MRLYSLKIFILSILLFCNLLAHSQSQITISLPVSTTCAGSVVKVRISSYSGVTWPIDNLQKKEQVNGIWGAWSNVGASINYDGISYYWNVTINNPTQFRAAEPVSGGTLLSNTVTENLYLPRLLIYGQDPGSSTYNYTSNQNYSIFFDINTIGNSNVNVTWYKNGVSVAQNPYTTSTCATCSYVYSYFGSQNETWKAYVYNNTLGCGAYTNEITIKPTYHITLASNKNIFNKNESAEIQVLSSYVAGATITLYKSEYISGLWGAWVAVATNSSLVYNYNGTYQYWSVPIAANTRFYAHAYPGGNVTSETIETDLIKSITTYQPRTKISDDGIVRSSIVDNVKKSTTYYDGLGRPIQNVSWQASPSKKDIIQEIVYDEFGRENKQYLPVVINSTDGGYEYGLINTAGNFVGPALNFYNNSADNIADDGTPYSVTIFENGPLNRVIKQGAVGTVWQPDATHSISSSDKTIKFDYSSNAGDEVLLWDYTYPTASLPFGIVNATATTTPTTPRYYPQNEIFKTITKDEQQNLAIEYKDKFNRVILKRVQLSNASPINDSNYASTYYIYDDFGQLVCVIPPEATARLATEYYHSSTSNTTKDNFMKRWAFRYSYDKSRRMIQKQVPGAEPVYMVYDNHNRLVMTQDGKQRVKKEWAYNKYDKFNRLIITGIYTHSSIINQESMGLLISSMLFSENYNGDQLTHGYTNTVWPTSNIQALTVTYYDSYSFKSMKNGLNYLAGQLTGQPTTEFATVRGLVTGQKINNLNESATYYWSITYYDDKYRPIQTISENHKGGKEIVTNVYNFADEITLTKRSHTYTGQPSITLEDEFTYDHTGRLLRQYNKIDGGIKIILADLKYNEIGQLVEKNLHSENLGSSYLQNIDYRYNIRGWLSHINNAALDIQNANNDDTDDLFGMELFYNTRPSGVAQSVKYNGNIAAVKWGVNDNGTKTYQGYGYAYDKLNRLTAGIHYNGSTTLTNSDLYKEYDITYDKNSNITALKRTANTSTIVDQLTYSYGTGTNRSNKLLRVTDGAGTIFDPLFKDGTNTGDDYAYTDGNGNMTSDQNKGISSVNYNLLNLPQSVTLATGTVIYTYDATGKKLTKQVTGTGAIAIDYLDGIQYINGIADIAQTTEGRIRKNGTLWNYEYDLKDHLGNVRVSFDKDPILGVARLIQKDDYYPFGLTFNSFTSGTENLYKFTGKEEQEETGWIDFGARMYQPDLGRWTSLDPLADVQKSYSPYNYVLNNPVSLIDPDGLIWEDPNEAEKLKAKAQKRIDELGKRKSKKEAKAAKREAAGKSTKNQTNAIARINSRTEQLEITKGNIDALGADQNNTYRLANGDNQGDGKHGVAKGADGVINIYGSSDALHIHEIRHVALSLGSESGLEFNASGSLKPTTLRGTFDEVEGYKAQYGYSGGGPGSAGSDDEIIQNIAELKDDKGNYVYPSIRQFYLNRQQGIRKSEQYKKKIEKGKTVNY